MCQCALGPAGRQVVIEERLEGRELSVPAVTDGERVHLLAPARDYKRLADGDRRPNTSGMGAFSPVSDVTPDLFDEVRRRILEPAVAGLAAEGSPFPGVLYAWLLTAESPRVLEFNCGAGPLGDGRRRMVGVTARGATLVKPGGGRTRSWNGSTFQAASSAATSPSTRSQDETVRHWLYSLNDLARCGRRALGQF